MPATNTGFRGIDVRQTANELVFTAFFQTSAGAKETAGPVTYALYELQSDGTFKSYDFANNTFTTGALTTATASMTHQKGNNNTVNTGVWTAALATLAGFTKGGIYLIQANDGGASPTDQTRQFQFGSVEGDQVVTTISGSDYLQTILQATGLANIGLETGVSLMQMFEFAGAALAGKFQKNIDGTFVIYACGNPTVPRIAGSLDGAGNRTITALTP